MNLLTIQSRNARAANRARPRPAAGCWAAAVTPSSARSPQSCRVRRASILLEVLITVTLIALFMALIGGQILSSVRAAATIEHRQTAMLLAESLVDRVQAGNFLAADQTQQQETGDFGTAYPGWGYQVDAEQTDDPNVLRVTMQVLEDETGQANTQTSSQTGTDVSSYTPIAEFTTFLTIPRKVDLVNDLGVSEQDAASIAAQFGNVDPSAIDPRMLAGMNLNDLSNLLPQLGPLLSQYGINLSDIGDLGAFTSQLQGLANSLGGNNNSGNNDNANGTGPVDFSELIRLGQQGDKQGMEEWINAAHGPAQRHGLRKRGARKMTPRRVTSRSKAVARLTPLRGRRTILGTQYSAQDPALITQYRP